MKTKLPIIQTKCAKIYFNTILYCYCNIFKNFDSNLPINIIIQSLDKIQIYKFIQVPANFLIEIFTFISCKTFFELSECKLFIGMIVNYFLPWGQIKNYIIKRIFNFVEIPNIITSLDLKFIFQFINMVC